MQESLDAGRPQCLRRSLQVIACVQEAGVLMPSCKGLSNVLRHSGSFTKQHACMRKAAAASQWISQLGAPSTG